jgi:hypothetical protein
MPAKLTSTRSHDADDDTDAIGTLPTPGIRTVISYLLFIHLFLLAMAVVGHLPPTSPLRTQLGEIPGLRHYPELLAMNSGYNFHLTYGLAEDTPTFLEVIPPASTTAEPLLFSPQAVSPAFRRAHYRNLLLEASIRADQRRSEGLLPRKIADYLLRERGLAANDTDLYRVRLSHRGLLPPQRVLSIDPAENDPLSDRLVQALFNVDVFYAGGNLEIIEVSSDVDSAALRTETPEQTPDK